MTSLTIRGARVSVLGLLASLAASPLAAQKLGTTEYTLRPGSVILDRCLDCGRAPREKPLRGRFLVTLEAIGNFTDWKNHDTYQESFDRLLKDLKPAIQMPKS